MSLLKELRLFLFYWIFHLCISLRYRIHIVGLDEIVKSNEQGILFLPNHPAEVDPLILTSVLWRDFRPRPLVVEHFYYLAGLRFFMDLVRVLPLPSMERGNKWKERQVEKLKQKILEKLDQQENFLIYPSGMLKLTAEERIGGASLIPGLLKAKPEAKVVLIRTSGLWGSTFSRALTGQSPNFGEALWHGFRVLLKNGIFFAPKRDITVELTFAPSEMPRQGDKKQLNEWLERWYNKNGKEKLTLVSFAFWKDEFPEVKPSEKVEEGEAPEIPEDMKAQLLGFLSKVTGVPVAELHPHLHFSNDLGLDSIDVSELNVFLEERFDITGLAPGQLQTVRDLFEAAAGVKKEVPSTQVKKKSKWPRESFRPDIKIGEGKTIQEVFLNNCSRMGNYIACADSLAGVLSYRRLKRAALILSLKIREMPGEKIGILLPSSVAGYLTILATFLAGKTPVMLNWTAGFRNLEHAADLCKLEVVLSSFRFLSRVENIDLGRVDDLLYLLEKIRSEISLKLKLKGLFLSFLSSKKLLKKLPNMPQESDPAVLIFTSGTETLPKAVPLTHYNLLSNQRSAFSCVSLKSDDTLYGVLPPFHSFGFSVTGIFPLLSGLKVCYAPDPTDAHSLANDIEHWKPTVFCCAPSFIQGMLRVASDKQLKSLRMVVSGAEKTPQELFDTLKAKNKVVLEGYGISECSPIVTLEREGEPHKGVGKPIPGIELCVIHPEEQTILATGQEGEICISGPSVFSGYLGVKTDPFIRIEDKNWYRSGDRGFLEADGTLILTGRLKRFVKIGGEMVSLGGIEEDLAKLYKEKGWIPPQHEGPPLAVAITGRESEKPQMTLFSIIDVDRDEINQALKDLGHGRLIKIAKVQKIDEIPKTGTGKIHYRLLDEML